MNYAVILAGGTGSRMKSIKVPKQYYEIEGTPIIIYTLKTFVEINCFDYIYIAIDDCYKDYVNSLLEKYFNKDVISKITLVKGGNERIDSIHNVIKLIELNEIYDNDIIVIHDSVRPFVTEKIILDNIEGAKEYGATVTSVPVNDTILLSTDGDYVDRIPIRKTLFNGQSPDSFNLKTFIELENKLTEEQKEIITGTSQVCTLNNYPIKMIEGDTINFKITTDADLELAEHIILKKGGL
ncbi:IspD/TarI family cytidylyltransferase [Methanobrevibacter millerae]|uniref:2-C-methyl-D-erythritol 4-phosphate cytidylyltransferase n=1 Tax=Methanobrevibacter millerae TaxID=230361 RepID=A0A1G5WWS4_9EURY|nr:IspD/TarI family cytidylyltransferase [Methanobrevibacter millerae]SDA62583.1 2-C-methyl-D-erythritol 4-phosphate cytidylyltransferase [Methanobrevibacter millerae]